MKKPIGGMDQNFTGNAGSDTVCCKMAKGETPNISITLFQTVACADSVPEILKPL
jgi:hypothetical protein